MKMFELTDENQKLFTDLFEETGYNNYIQLRLVGVAKSKEVIKVKCPSADTKHFGHLPDDVVTVLVYEDAFDRLDEKNKKLLIRDAFNLVSYDGDKDKISIGSPMITVTVAGREKWGDELINASEMAVMMIQQIDDEKKALKEARKAAEKAAKKQYKNK